MTLPEQDSEDDALDTQVRPQMLDDFIGQSGLKANLQVFIRAAQKRREPLDHILFHGPPGLGKTTFARIIANEMNSRFRTTSGPVIAKAGDLAALLTNLEAFDVLFIDEIHRLAPAVEEILYPAMEDFKLDIVLGEGPAARSIEITLPPFTLVAATTRAGLITKPLRERFGIPMQLDFYSSDELCTIVTRAAKILACPIALDGALEIAKRSRGTPRTALRLLRRVRDFWQISQQSEITKRLADDALMRLNIDAVGLDKFDRDYLLMIAQKFSGGPVGLESLSAALSVERDSLEEVTEPYLIQQGLIQRTPRGRLLTPRSFDYLNLPTPKNLTKPLFDDAS